VLPGVAGSGGVVTMSATLPSALNSVNVTNNVQTGAPALSGSERHGLSTTFTATVAGVPGVIDTPVGVLGSVEPVPVVRA
jgi:hypothetical protein